MARFSLSIVQSKRRQRFGLLRFFQLLHLELISGYELNHAWEQSESLLASLSEDPLYFILKKGELGLQDHLVSLSKDERLYQHRSWFRALASLYQNGAEMGCAVQGIIHSLHREDTTDLENHFRVLPTRLQVILILFFFPPTVLLLIMPLLGSFQF